MNAIAAALEKVTIDSPVSEGNLTMFPLLALEETEPAYSTLDEALAKGEFQVTEVSESGSVPQLLVLNEGGVAVLIADGEELVGAKQNRVVNLSIMVPAHSRITVPVSCVESGRWHHQSRHFSTAERSYYASGRAMKTRHVSDSLRTVGERSSDQHAIWRDIAEKSDRMSAHSATAAMDTMYEKSEDTLRQLAGRFEPRPRQTGAIFCIDGVPVGLDLFDSPATWRKLSAKLVRGYGLDAVDLASSARRGGREQAAPADLLRAATTLQEEQYPAVGLGEDLRLSGATLAGGALVVDGRVVHLAVFPSGSAQGVS